MRHREDQVGSVSASVAGILPVDNGGGVDGVSLKARALPVLGSERRSRPSPVDNSSSYPPGRAPDRGAC